MEEQICEKDEQQKQRREPNDHQPEIADADCEGGRRGLLLQSVCDRSKLGLASRRENHGLGGSADDRATHEDQIAGKGTLVPGCGGQYGVLFGRIGLARQQRLVDVKVARFDQTSIGGNEVTGAEKDDVAGDDFRRRDADGLPVAQNLRRERDLVAQPRRGALGPVFLHDVKNHRHENDGGNDDKARNIAGRRRYTCRAQQHKNQRVAEAREKGREDMFAACSFDLIRSSCNECRGGGRTAKSILVRVQRRKKVWESSLSDLRSDEFAFWSFGWDVSHS